MREDRDIFSQDLFDEVPYFLLDGWDEISDNRVANIILDAIHEIAKRSIGRVIVTSRRAGRLNGFNAFASYEIVHLSSRSIRNYIINFSKAQSINSVEMRGRLLNSILNSDHLSSWLKIPFCSRIHD